MHVQGLAIIPKVAGSDRGAVEPRSAIEIIHLRPTRDRRGMRNVSRRVVHQAHHQAQGRFGAAQRRGGGEEAVGKVGGVVETEILLGRGQIESGRGGESAGCSGAALCECGWAADRRSKQHDNCCKQDCENQWLTESSRPAPAPSRTRTLACPNSEADFWWHCSPPIRCHARDPGTHREISSA